MEGTSIFEDDVVVVDRALDAREYAIMIALLNSAFTVKRFITSGKARLLMPENPRYEALPRTCEMDFRV